MELATEIAVDFPEKKVTLVHEGPRLMPSLGPNASEKALRWLTSRGVEVLLQQSVELDSAGDHCRDFTASAGRKITADCHFVCAGRPVVSTPWLEETMMKDKLERFGRLMANSNLTVNGHKNVFTIGGIAEVSSQQKSKQDSAAFKQAAVAARNMKVSMGEDGGKEQKLVEYKLPGQSLAMAFVSLRRKEALTQFSFTTASGHVPGCYVSKDLFVGSTRQKMGHQSTKYLKYYVSFELFEGFEGSGML